MTRIKWDLYRPQEFRWVRTGHCRGGYEVGVSFYWRVETSGSGHEVESDVRPGGPGTIRDPDEEGTVAVRLSEKDGCKGSGRV